MFMVINAKPAPAVKKNTSKAIVKPVATPSTPIATYEPPITIAPISTVFALPILFAISAAGKANTKVAIPKGIIARAPGSILSGSPPTSPNTFFEYSDIKVSTALFDIYAKNTTSRDNITFNFIVLLTPPC